MEFVMSMVHHNPGEEPFVTKFENPEIIKEMGANTQVFKHINTAITFSNYDEELFAEAPDELEWINNMSDKLMLEINAAKEAGLKVYYHIDLFVLPKALYNKYKDEICDENGKISLHRQKTLEIHSAMLDEMFKRFPIDGLIIRVGETYLHDTPYHIGNGAVKYGDTESEKHEFIKLIRFLREEVCVKHNKHLFFRTWDCFPDKFHANPKYYSDVTDKIEPHEKLVFSIKHTALDFWRRTGFNECLGIGKHRQIIEVQCQREYEGKGAYPMYVMKGVINSFSENEEPKGIRGLQDNPLICGLYVWPRGGGWKGPYPKNEFWCELNTYVILQYGENPKRGEEEIFYRYAGDRLGLSKGDARVFRKMCIIASEAVLKGRYIECYDRSLNENLMPCGNWLRDDRIGGMNQLKPIFEYLFKYDLLEEALLEKKTAVFIWQEVRRLFDTITIPDKERSEFIKTSIDYGMHLYNAIYYGFNALAKVYIFENTNGCDLSDLKLAVDEYDKAWAEYKKLADNPYASSLYEDTYIFAPGLRESIEKYRA